MSCCCGQLRFNLAWLTVQGGAGEAWQMWLPLQLTKTNDNHLEQTHLPKSCAINKFAVQTEKDRHMGRGRERKRGGGGEERDMCLAHL